MDPRAARLFEGRNLAFLATVMADGSPQVSPVWAEYSGGLVLVNTAEGRAKHRNVLRDPRVAVSLVSAQDPLEMASVRGTVEGVEPDPDYAHADRLASKYMGLDRYPFRRPGERRIILRIRPASTYVMPEPGTGGR